MFDSVLRSYQIIHSKQQSGDCEPSLNTFLISEIDVNTALKMSWMGSLGWKEGLSSIQLQKVEELEKNLSKANNNANQKQILIDGLNQSLDKLKRKVR